MRYAVPVSIAIGLAIGIIGTVMAINALRSGPDMPAALMHMQDFHMDAMGANMKQNHCAATDNLPHLQTLRALSNDIEPIFLPAEKEAKFLPAGKEADFRQKASNLRAALDATLAAPPAECASLGAAMSRIGHECKACHQEYKN